MQRVVITLGLILVATPVLAEDTWLDKAPWTQDYAKALKEAKKADKLVFAFFTKPG